MIRDEVLPAEPDLVVYYEGANQSLCTRAVPDAPRPGRSYVSVVGQRVATATGSYLQMGRRLEQLMQRIDANGGNEVPKPAIDVNWWPAGLDEKAPDVSRTDLPNEERAILASLETARVVLADTGAELALSSFAWLVHDGLQLDPLRHVVIHNHINERCWPYRYANIRRALDLHNRLLEQYALKHGMPFIDVASPFPGDPDLFSDAIHLNSEGTRAHAWIVFRALVPLVRARIASGTWPRPDRVPLAEHPNIEPGRPYVVTCPRGIPRPHVPPTAPRSQSDDSFF